MYRFARNDEIDLDELRVRLRKMPDDDLVRFGKAARFMCRDKQPRVSRFRRFIRPTEITNGNKW